MNREITSILQAIESGEQSATDDLLPLVYDELRRLAAAKLARENAQQTLQATALVHEAYLRLIGKDNLDESQWNSRGHFFAAASEAMRRILVDRARARNAQKRGGEHQRVELEHIEHPAAKDPGHLLALNDALEKLESSDPDKASLVKLRFFGGLTNRQAAEALGISEATADRHWAFARAWLKVQMGD